MREAFPGYYGPTEEEFSELWQTGTFIVDTSVLLNLYRYPEKAREDLALILERISSQLWVPHQAALEYQENRPMVIVEQKSRYSKVRTTLAEIKKEFKSKLDRLDLKKRHASIDPDELLRKVDAAFQDLEKELKKKEVEQADWYETNELRDRIDRLLEGRVGPPPASQDALEKIYEEGALRYGREIPPGYRDRVKGDDDRKGKERHVHNGLAFKREYGDLILWKEIIEEAQAQNLERIALVTDDRKDDWWWIVESEGAKTIGPHPELVGEMLRETSVSCFYMYTPDRFMEYAKQYLNVEIDNESIEQAQEIGERRRDSQPIALGERHIFAHAALIHWLHTKYPDSNIVPRDPPAAIGTVHLKHSDGTMIRYYIRVSDVLPRDVHELAITLNHAIGRHKQQLLDGVMDELVLVYMVEDERDVDELLTHILRVAKLDELAFITVILGVLISAQGLPRFKFVDSLGKPMP